MKSKIFFSILVGCVLFCTGCRHMKVVRGDGEVITREIDIQDYNQLEIYTSNAIVNYVQNSEAPSLTVTTDQNIYDIYDLEIRGNTLRIVPKEKYKKHAVLPTRFVVETNSAGLREVDAAGRMDFNVNSVLTADKLELSMAGKTNINLKDSVQVASLEINMAGGVSFISHSLYGGKCEVNAAGSGKLSLGGRMERLIVEAAGKAEVNAFDLEVDHVVCEVAGKCNVDITVNHSIRLEVAGKANIRYKGDPQNIERQSVGMSSIKKVD